MSHSITKQNLNIHECKIVHTGAFPTSLSFTCTDYFYSKLYYGPLAASANGTVDEDEGSSLQVETTFGSVEGRMTLASDLVSTPSAV